MCLWPVVIIRCLWPEVIIRCLCPEVIIRRLLPQGIDSEEKQNDNLDSFLSIPFNKVFYNCNLQFFWKTCYDLKY